MFHTPYPEHKRLAVLLGAGVATTGALLLITRKLTARARLDISSLDELEDYETRGLVVGLLSAPPRVAIVRLAGLGTLLPTIPSSVLRMGPALQELDLSGCSLTTLPDSIARLSGLKRLSLSRNQLGELPPAIGKLAGLVDLDISNNQLPALPEEIGALSSLRYLNAMANQLDTLPASIGSLSALYRLGLKSNRLTSLPASIGGLASLVEIFLTDNLLESLPPEMGKLTALVKFQASFNKFKSLPEELADLPNLELLRVACCELGQCPVGMREAHKHPRLAWFSVAGNPCCPIRSPRSRVPTVQLTDLEVGRKLGDGASGEVFEAVWQGKRVALKLFRGDRSPDGHCRDEMALAIALQGDRNLVKILAQLQEPLGLVMQFAEGRPLAEKPNLESLLRCRWALGITYPLAFILKVAHGLAGALEHMHYCGICHGDVYAHNVLVDEKADSVILCDYGAAFPYAKTRPFFGGLAPYEAGEVRAYGLLLSDMVARMEMTFDGMEVLIQCQRELLELIQTCTSAAPAKRPCFGSVGRRIKAIQGVLDRGLKATPKAGYSDSVQSMELSRPGADGASTPRSLAELPTPEPGSHLPGSIPESE